MSKRHLPIAEVGKQIALFEVEPVPASVKPPKPKTAQKECARQEEPKREAERPTAAIDPSLGTPQPDARSLLAEMLPLWALNQAQRELSDMAPVDPATDHNAL
jgi:hypothetical protein